MDLFTWEGLEEEQVLFLDDENRKITGKDLKNFSEKQCKKMESGKLLFLLCQNKVECMMTYLSALHKGVLVLLLDDGINDELLNNLEETYKPNYIACTDKNRKLSGYHILEKAGDYLFYCRQEAVEHTYNRDLALLLTTSGSTGSPKLVKISKENIISNAESIAQYLKISKDQRPVTVLPMHYTFGLSIVHSHLCKNATILVTNKTLLEKEFWDFIKKEKATSISGVPYTYEILKRVGFLDRDDLSIKTLTQAGGKLPEQLQEEYAVFSRKNGIDFYVMYGQTEATARMGYLPPEYSCEKIGSMGIAIPGGRFELQDEGENPITEPYKIGELIYYGKNVTLGYAQNLEDLKAEDQWKGCLRTGDMACFDEDGFFYIKGRNKRFIKMFGNRISLDEIERLLKNHFEVDCAATGIDNELRIWYVKENQLDENEMKSFLWETTNISERNMKFQVIKSIPRNSSGKTIYKEIEENTKI